MKNLFAIRSQKVSVDFMLLLVRVAMGCAFVIHGYGKIQNPFGWMGADSQIPAAFQGLAALAEFGGGMSLVVGLLSALGAFGLTCTMGVAVYMHRFVFGDPFVNPTGGHSYELATIYLAVALLLLFTGPGRFSGDRVIFGQKA